MSTKQQITMMAKKAYQASFKMAVLSAKKKNKALMAMADALEKASGRIIRENKKDINLAKCSGRGSAFIGRLVLDKAKVKKMAQSIREVARLKDPVGEVLKKWKRPNGMRIQKVRVPIGVIGIIYESRPDVTSDCASLCIKSGNSVILRGGKEALRSNIAIFDAINKAAGRSGLPEGAVNLVKTTEHKLVRQMLELHEYINLIIPRGGEGLIRNVVAHSKIPVIKHYKGVCHTFVDKYADLKMAQKICFNAKVQRPETCNAMETLLVHQAVARKFLPAMIDRLKKAGVDIKGCPGTKKIVKGIKKAGEADWNTEYLDMILSVRVVKDIDQAIEHVNKYGTKHSDAIITRSRKNAAKFLDEVDSSAVYVNASTRLTDGGQFGFGAEIGISTDKLHARGPMALEELCSYKYQVSGSGQIRK
jgi:glutamate-5-semialdehyde dehydrogenase